MLVIASNIRKTPLDYAKQILEMSSQDQVRDISMGKLGLCHLFTARSLKTALSKHNPNDLYVLVLTTGTDMVVHSLLVSDSGVIADRDSQYFVSMYKDNVGRYKIVYDYKQEKQSHLFIHSFKVSSL